MMLMLMMLKMMAIFDNDGDEDAILEDKGQEGTRLSEWSQSRHHGQRADLDAACLAFDLNSHYHSLCHSKCFMVILANSYKQHTL